MRKLHLALLLAAAAAAPVRGQTPAAPQAVPIEPSADSAEQRQGLIEFSACLAHSRPRWARQTLAHPYLSEAQASKASGALKGTDSCTGRKDTEVTFRTSGLVGGLAEYFLRSELDKADGVRLERALNTVAPLNASEDFGLCVASRNAAAARALALSVPGSAAETAAVDTLRPEIAPCIRGGEHLTIDLQSLRALVSTALYRGVTAIVASRS
jgi:hypothetical protein